MHSMYILSLPHTGNNFYFLWSASYDAVEIHVLPSYRMPGSYNSAPGRSSGIPDSARSLCRSKPYRAHMYNDCHHEARSHWRNWNYCRRGFYILRSSAGWTSYNHVRHFSRHFPPPHKLLHSLRQAASHIMPVPARSHYLLLIQPKNLPAA